MWSYIVIGVNEGFKKIYLHKLNEVAKVARSEVKPNTWQLKVTDFLIFCSYFTLLCLISRSKPRRVFGVN